MEVKFTKLKHHPKNSYYFPELDIEAMKDLVKSIDEDGLIHKIVTKEDGTIISGHQRYEALKKLGKDMGETEEETEEYIIKECIEIKEFGEDEILEIRALIKANTEGRGNVGNLERVYQKRIAGFLAQFQLQDGVKKGVPIDTPLEKNYLTREEIAKEMGISVTDYNRLKKIAETPILNEIMENGGITPSTAVRLVKGLDSHTLNEIHRQVKINSSLFNKTPAELAQDLKENLEQTQKLMNENKELSHKIAYMQQNISENADEDRRIVIQNLQKEIQELKTKGIIEKTVEIVKEIEVEKIVPPLDYENTKRLNDSYLAINEDLKTELKIMEDKYKKKLKEMEQQVKASGAIAGLKTVTNSYMSLSASTIKILSGIDEVGIVLSTIIADGKTTDRNKYEFFLRMKKAHDALGVLMNEISKGANLKAIDEEIGYMNNKK